MRNYNQLRETCLQRSNIIAQKHAKYNFSIFKHAKLQSIILTGSHGIVC